MTGPVVVLATEIAGGLIFAGALVDDSGRTAVLGLVGLVVIACAKWLWGAIVRQIKAAAHANGTRSLRLAALDLVRRGATPLDEIKRVTLHA